jgi:hypothetical protein
MSDEEWEQILDKRYRDERIRKEGLDTTVWEADEGQTCIRSKTKPISPRRQVTEPCGDPAILGLCFRTPENPEGVYIPLCRSCFVAELKNLMSYLN